MPSTEEITTDVSWIDLPNLRDAGKYRGKDQVSIREWMPGDGLLCRWASNSLAVPCGAPVAVIQRRRIEMSYRPGKYGREEEKLHHSVVCSLHAADVIRQLVMPNNQPSISTESQRVAREAVIAAHWDEYQEVLANAVRQAKEDALSLVPQQFRKYIADEEVS